MVIPATYEIFTEKYLSVFTDNFIHAGVLCACLDADRICYTLNIHNNLGSVMPFQNKDIMRKQLRTVFEKIKPKRFFYTYPEYKKICSEREPWCMFRQLYTLEVYLSTSNMHGYMISAKRFYAYALAHGVSTIYLMSHIEGFLTDYLIDTCDIFYRNRIWDITPILSWKQFS